MKPAFHPVTVRRWTDFEQLFESKMGFVPTFEKAGFRFVKTAVIFRRKDPLSHP
jgi:hypothetical protein